MDFHGTVQGEAGCGGRVIVSINLAIKSARSQQTSRGLLYRICARGKIYCPNNCLFSISVSI
jgi:hypothetical protein